MSSENVESLSYKFQRLRERLREAISNGELAGKLPGERALAKQFQVNAKTLSKALTDLAAEGILDRSIGRGTYVKGQTPVSTAASRWLVLAEPDTPEELIEAIRQKNESIHVLTDPIEKIRPSFINQFSAVIDLARNTPESFLRDLVVRNISVVVVGREPRTYSMNAVMLDLELGASRVARQLLLSGHRRIVVAADEGQSEIVQAARQAAARIDESATVDSVSAKDAVLAVREGATAVLCVSSSVAKEVMAGLKAANASAEVVGIGMGSSDIACNGCYISPEQIAAATADLLSPHQSTRPAALWLAGNYKHDNGSVPVSLQSPLLQSLTAGASQA